MEDSPRPWTIERLAERWECSTTHVREAIRSGKLQHFRIGRLIRVPHSVVEAFEATREPLPPPEETAGEAAEAGQRRALTIADVAQRWDCSRERVRQAMATGELKHFRVGKLFRTRPEWVSEAEARELQAREEAEKQAAAAPRSHAPWIPKIRGLP